MAARSRMLIESEQVSETKWTGSACLKRDLALTKRK